MRRKPQTPAIKIKEQPATADKEPLLKKRKVVDIPLMEKQKKPVQNTQNT